MTLFSSDLYRNFGIGFGVGAVLVVLSNFDGILTAVPRLVASIF
jgi:hypothetical protein